MGNELSGFHINKAQCLLNTQFLQVNGLTLSLLQSKDLQPTGSVSNKIQIIHCSKRYHWVVATTVNCRDGKDFVFDFDTNHWMMGPKPQFSAYFRMALSLKSKWSIHRSKKEVTTGLFAMTYATAIAFHQFPPFRQELRWAHLVTCLSWTRSYHFHEYFGGLWTLNKKMWCSILIDDALCIIYCKKLNTNQDNFTIW